jgi:hypothetical protein
MYPKNTIYIIGHGRTGANNAITKYYQQFFIGFVIDVETDVIVDVSCTHMIDTTEKFIRSIFLSKNMLISSEIEEEINKRYFASSQKAIFIAFKDAQSKYREIKDKYNKK